MNFVRTNPWICICLITAPALVFGEQIGEACALAIVKLAVSCNLPKVLDAMLAIADWCGK